MNDGLTERQRREIEYHKDHARTVADKSQVVEYDVVTSHSRRWWNAFWDTWTYLMGLQLSGERVLVVGCGSGQDAMLFAKLGAKVSAFDLSPEMLAYGVRLAKQEGLNIEFAEMPAEKMTFPDGSFDIVYCRDILHHVDIPATMREISRVSKPNALIIVNEIYSHSITDIVRRSDLVERKLYPAMRKFVYKGEKPYITADERKMSEHDIALVTSRFSSLEKRKYFNWIVTRLIPDKFPILNKLDRVGLVLLGPLGRFLAGRIVLVGRLK
jgi:ubiquinone/menaquinone biosynthesis C-methylase UbiE